MRSVEACSFFGHGWHLLGVSRATFVVRGVENSGCVYVAQGCESTSTSLRPAPKRTTDKGEAASRWRVSCQFGVSIFTSAICLGIRNRQQLIHRLTPVAFLMSSQFRVHITDVKRHGDERGTLGHSGVELAKDKLAAEYFHRFENLCQGNAQITSK